MTFDVFVADVDQPGQVRFASMTPGLGTAHRIATSIGGFDPTAWELKLAARERLASKQSDLQPHDPAMMARLVAGEVAAGQYPENGTLVHLAFPPDVGVAFAAPVGTRPLPGQLVASLTVTGKTRDAVVADLRRTLGKTEIAGISTNHAFLRRLAADPEVTAGRPDTDLILRAHDRLSAPLTPCTRCRSIAAVSALDERAVAAHGSALQSVRLIHGFEEVLADIAVEGADRFDVSIGSARHLLQRTTTGWCIDGDDIAARIHRTKSEVTVFWGNCYRFLIT